MESFRRFLSCFLFDFLVPSPCPFLRFPFPRFHFPAPFPVSSVCSLPRPFFQFPFPCPFCLLSLSMFTLSFSLSDCHFSPFPFLFPAFRFPCPFPDPLQARPARPSVPSEHQLVPAWALASPGE